MRKNPLRYIISGGLIAGITALVFIVIVVASAYQQTVAIIVSKKNMESSGTAGYNLPQFITDDMMEAFFETQKKYGIPVSTGVAQVIAESGFGIYGPGGESGQGLSKLAYEQKNLFGIKYFTGDKFAIGSYNYNTGEQTSSGGSYEVNAGFSVYKNYGDCIRQRAWMLMREPYYSHTVAKYKNNNDGRYTKTSANGFAEGIREAGWATSITYVQTLKSHMESYNLYQFDNMTYEEYKAKKSTDGNVNFVYSGQVTEGMKRIVSIAKNNQGSYPCTPDMCAAWVTGVYQAAGASVIPYGDAIDMWNTYQNTGSTSMDNIPPGAIVCGSGSGYMGSLYGHVGVYLGNGQVANNVGHFSIEDINSWCSWQTATCQGHTGWIGWIYPGGMSD